MLYVDLTKLFPFKQTTFKQSTFSQFQKPQPGKPKMKKQNKSLFITIVLTIYYPIVCYAYVDLAKLFTLKQTTFNLRSLFCA